MCLCTSICVSVGGEPRQTGEPGCVFVLTFASGIAIFHHFHPPSSFRPAPPPPSPITIVSFFSECLYSNSMVNVYGFISMIVPKIFHKSTPRVHSRLAYGIHTPCRSTHHEYIRHHYNRKPIICKYYRTNPFGKGRWKWEVVNFEWMVWLRFFLLFLLFFFLISLRSHRLPVGRQTVSGDGMSARDMYCVGECERTATNHIFCSFCRRRNCRTTNNCMRLIFSFHWTIGAFYYFFYFFSSLLTNLYRTPTSQLNIERVCIFPLDLDNFLFRRSLV